MVFILDQWEGVYELLMVFILDQWEGVYELLMVFILDQWEGFKFICNLGPVSDQNTAINHTIYVRRLLPAPHNGSLFKLKIRI